VKKKTPKKLPVVINTHVEIIDGKEFVVSVLQDGRRPQPAPTWGRSHGGTSRPTMSKKQRQEAAKRQSERERRTL
jgi:hypothetical protein